MPRIISLSYRDLMGPSCSRESFTCPAKQAVLIARHDLVLESTKPVLSSPNPTGDLEESCREWANVGQRPDPPRCQRGGEGGDQTYVHDWREGGGSHAAPATRVSSVAATRRLRARISGPGDQTPFAWWCTTLMRFRIALGPHEV